MLADADPPIALLRTLERLDAAGDAATQASLFESLLWRVEVHDYWVWFRMARVYAALGREDSRFLCAARAAQLEPDLEATGQCYRDLLHFFGARGNAPARAAVAPRAGADATATAPRAEAAPSLVNPEVLQPLIAVLLHELRRPGATIEAATTASDVEGWDSLTHARLLLAVERAFGISFGAGEGWSIESVGDLAALVERHLPRRGRPKLIVWGNCQAGAVGVLLRNTPAIHARFDVVEHDLWATGDKLAANVSDFDHAEVLLLQDMRPWQKHPLRERLPAGLRVVRFPFYYVGALWPFDSLQAGADAPMDRAVRAAERAGAPLPFGFQDGLLARLRDTVPDPEERFRRYRDLDIADVLDIRRLAELDQARLLREDARYGSTVGRYIVDHYRHERLFHAIAHPTVGLIERVAKELVARAGLDPGPAGLGTYGDYMGEYQVPLHPHVIRDLGITWADAQTRYVMKVGPPVTFEEYYRRYIATPVA